MNSYIRYIVSAFFLFFFMGSAFAQENEYDFYYYKGKSIPLELDTRTIFVSATNTEDISNIVLDRTQFNILSVSEIQVDNSSRILNTPENFKQENPTRYWREITFSGNRISKEEYSNRISQLELNNKNIIISPYFKKTEDSNIGLSNYFYIKLRHQDDFNILLEQVKRYKLELVGYNKYMPLWFTLSVTPESANVLKMANTLYETGSFADVDPAFMFDFRESCRNDTEFNQLWGLENTTDPNIDINACPAWEITEGGGVNVAVLDQGVFTTHNDLAANISPLSYDTQTGTSPSVFNPGNDHGTHVSGTIAAVGDNNLQVVGVAPQSNIISVSHILSLTPNVSQELADGINWAWQNGADIINNSWGDQGGTFFTELQSAMLEDAILDALELGRSGLGTVVVFASGNRTPLPIDYPGNFHEDILCVGSINSTGQRSASSAFGAELDIVAPGVGIVSTVPPNTTGPDSGTSMAAPHAAGVAALILSVNNGLSVVEVNNIIEESAQKIRTDLYTYSTAPGRPNGDWNGEMGYGLLDAHAAVLLSQNTACPMDLFVDTDVPSGVDNREADLTITADNTISSGAEATYHAGNEVLLINNFEALDGSSFRAYLEACSGDFLNFQGNPEQEIIAYEIPEGIIFNEDRIADLTNELKTNPTQTKLKNIPNPFSQRTTIEFELEQKSVIRLEIFDLSGRQIITLINDQSLDAGIHSLEYNAKDLQDGIYLYRLSTEHETVTQKMVLSR